MQDQTDKSSELKKTDSVSNTVVIAFLAVIALLGTYFLAHSGFEMWVVTSSFLGIVVSFLAAVLALHLRIKRTALDLPADDAESANDRQLQALSDANEFFAGSLRRSDSFRLVASRCREILPFRTITLHLFDERGMNFHAVESDGPDAEHRRGRFAELNDGPVARSYFSQIIEIDHATTSTRPSVVIPLKSANEIFGMLHLDFEMNLDPNELDLSLLDAIGSRSGPLIHSSVCYEESQTSALTDSVTDLPNERAFFMVLENQVAESQRKGSTRPLTVLALDVRSFDDINSRFGHASGDQILSFAAQVIKDNLRQMDFLARASADEFLIALPTASREISHDVIARVQTGFFGRRLMVTDIESVEIEMNVGWAAFGLDGETPETLLRIARERKEQSKTSAPSKVLWFPTEIAN